MGVALKMWFPLALAPAVGAALMAPVVFDAMLASGAVPPGTPRPPELVLIAAAGLQTLVMFGLAAAAGLWLSARVGRSPAVLRAWVSGQRPEQGVLRRLAEAAVVGALVGGLLVALDVYGFRSAPETLPGSAGVRLAGAMLYGGVGEEVLCRLFLVSGLVWAAGLVTRRTPGAGIWLFAIVAAALLFGAGHLPLAAAMGMADAAGITRVMVLNGVGGLVFGLLFWRRGLEAAVVAHAAAHLPLQLLPSLLG